MNNLITIIISILAIYYKDFIYVNNTINYFTINNNNLFEKSSTNLRSYNHYTNNINSICPGELINNFAGKKGLYFNTTNAKIKKSILKKYFHHCGAWCLFDYTDPRKGWRWNSTFFEWVYYNELYLICPANEFYYALNKFFNENSFFL